jgi:hypothetical protein
VNRMYMGKTGSHEWTLFFKFDVDEGAGGREGGIPMATGIKVDSLSFRSCGSCSVLEF